jgi:hypothetical protein
MKSLKIALAAFLLLAVTSAFVLTKNQAKPLVDVCQELAWDGDNMGGNDFIIASSDKDELDIATNWASFQECGTLDCGDETSRICKLVITYSYTGTDPAPTIGEVLTALKANYNNTTPNAHFFTSDPFTYQDPSTSVTITVDIVEKGEN